MADRSLQEEAAAAAEQRGDWSLAEQHWRALVHAQPGHGAAWHRLGKSLAEQQRWAEALDCQRRSCQLHPQLGWNWFALGEALEQLGCGEEAAAAFRQAVWWLPQEGWIRELAKQSEQRAWLGGEELREGFGFKAYRHWCERLEPPLPKPGTLLTEHWWLQQEPHLWARLDAQQRVVERQRGLWPSGDGWLLQLASDARLRREALQAMEAAITAAEAHPQLVYPDEDRLDHEGQRHDPWFKPGWVPESFWSSPWLEACSAWSLKWLRTEGLPPPPIAHSPQLLAWQLEALTREPQVLAIPRVLVHRCSEGRYQKTELKAKAAALEQHLRKRGERVYVMPKGEQGQFQLQWSLPVNPPGVHVVIPSRDQALLLNQCLESLERTCGSYKALHITVVDHRSREPATASLLQSWRERLGDRFQVLRRGGSFNWSRLNNQAIRSSNTPLVLLLNNDVQALQAGWLEAMAAQALRPEVGAVGAVLLYPDSRIQHAGIQLGFGASGQGAEHTYRGINWTALVGRHRARLLTGWAAATGACLMTRKDTWKAVGGFDERFPVEYNDVDYCLNLLDRGLRTVVEPAALLIHHECQTRDPTISRSLARSLKLMERKHGERIIQAHPWIPQAYSHRHPDGRPRELDGYP